MDTQPSNFFAYLFRMRLINRWSLMNNTYQENIQGHSLEVAAIAHCLVILKNKLTGTNLSPDRVVTLALYHDATEVISGDLPTPVKYFNPKIKEAYKEIEEYAADYFLKMVPSELRKEYKALFFKEENDSQYWKIVKHADRIAAYLKCIEEIKTGNKEFVKAERQLKSDIDLINDEEVKYFISTFVGAFYLTLDELSDQ